MLLLRPLVEGDRHHNKGYKERRVTLKIILPLAVRRAGCRWLV